MLRRIALWMAGALLLAGCSAPDPLADHDWPDASPALWQITSFEGEMGWLFGTVHALPDGLDWQSDAVDAAFAQSGLLVVEIAELEDSDLAASEFSSRSNSDGLPALLDRVPPSDRPALERLLEEAGQSESDFARTESWAAALILSGSMRSGDPANGVDRAFLSRADNVAGLEGLARQYAVFDALPQSEQVDLLVSIASESESYDPAASLEAWLTGDMAQLERLGSTGILADPELRDALLDHRNRNWLPAILGHVDGGAKPFIAVGAAHMFGDAGLPALLRAEGYAVTRIQ